MFLSLCDELVLLSYWEIRLQFDKDSRKSTSKYVYTISGFLLFLQQQRKPFGLWVVPLTISSKILLCDNSGMMAWSKELKYHQKRKHINKKCYLIVRQYIEVMRYGTNFFLWCPYDQWDFVGIEPSKARHDVTKLDLTIPLLSFWCINIDLSIQFMSLTLYMIWVHQELHRIYKSWAPCKQVIYPPLVHGFGQSNRDCSAPPPNQRDGLSQPSEWVSHGECTSVCDAYWIGLTVNHDTRQSIIIIHQVTILHGL